MKALILSTLLLCGHVMADSFTFFSPEAATFQTDTTYALMSEVKVTFGGVSFAEKDKANVFINVNGKGALYSADIISGDMFYFGENKYKVTLKTDILKDQICGEQETVAYELTFTERGEYTHYSYITGAALNAVKSYTYDSCHAYTEYSKYSYEVK